jgi:hypothetical protein
MKMLLLLILGTLSISLASAGEVDCLARITYTEARGEPIIGAAGVAQAAINRAHRKGKSICSLIIKKEVKAVPSIRNEAHRFVFQSIAGALIRNPQKKLVGDADSWNTGKRPAYKAKGTPNKIGRHVIYKMANLG